MNNANAALWTTTSMEADDSSGFQGVGYKAAVRDFNGDGLADVVLPVTSPAASGLSGFLVFSGTSKSTWGTGVPWNLASGTGPNAVATADFNGDKFFDFVGVDVLANQAEIDTSDGTFGFGGCSPGGNVTKICGPSQASIVTSPFHVSAGSSREVSPDANVSITAAKAYLDGKQVLSSTKGFFETNLTASVGTHSLVVNVWDNTGFLTQDKVTFTIAAVPGGTTTCTAPTTAGVKLCAPAAGASVTSPVAISAAANGGSRSITAMRAYLDNKQVAASSTGTLNAAVAASVGSHTLIVKAWNSAGTLFTKTVTFTVH